jgi:hypothetical protein
MAFMAPNGMFSRNTLGVATVATDGKFEVRAFATDRKQHFDPWMTVDDAGILHLVWLGHDGGFPEKRMMVGHATSRDGLTWSAVVAINDTAIDCPANARGCMDKPMIIADGEDIVAFYYSDPGGGLKAVRAGTDGQAAGPSAKVGDGAYASVYRGASSTLHVVYVAEDDEASDRFGDEHMHVDYVHSRDGGRTFSTAARVSAAGEPVPFFFSNPQIIADEPRGFLYTVYPTGRRDGSWEIILATSRDGGATWSRIRVNDDAACANHMAPVAALDSYTGAIHIIWPENRTGVGGLAYAHCEAGGTRCSANEAVSEQPFTSYSFARHRTDWLAEYNALLVDVNRRVLHAIWTQPVDERGHPVSRLFYARAALPSVEATPQPSQ